MGFSMTLSPAEQAQFDAKYEYVENVLVNRGTAHAVETCRLVNSTSGAITPLRVVFVRETGEHGDIVRALNGVTGHESYYVDGVIEKLTSAPDDARWMLCAGTKNSWNELSITIPRFRNVLGALGFDIPAAAAV